MIDIESARMFCVDNCKLGHVAGCPLIKLAEIGYAVKLSGLLGAWDCFDEDYDAFSVAMDCVSEAVGS